MTLLWIKENRKNRGKCIYPQRTVSDRDILSLPDIGQKMTRIINIVKKPAHQPKKHRPKEKDRHKKVGRLLRKET